MAHVRARKLMAAYAELCPADRAMLDCHVNVCPQCAAYFRLCQRMDADLAGLPDLRPARSAAAMRLAATAPMLNRTPAGVAGQMRGLASALTPMFALAVLTAGLLFALQAVPQHGFEGSTPASSTPTPSPLASLATPFSAPALSSQTAVLGTTAAARRAPPTAAATLLPLATGSMARPTVFRHPTP